MRRATDALVQLDKAFDAPDMVDIEYAHVHAGMALYRGDVEMIEEPADLNARMAVPASTNIANADMERNTQFKAPPALLELQLRAEAAHKRMGGSACFTCATYLAGNRPTWKSDDVEQCRVLELDHRLIDEGRYHSPDRLRKNYMPHQLNIRHSDGARRLPLALVDRDYAASENLRGEATHVERQSNSRGQPREQLNFDQDRRREKTRRSEPASGCT